MISKLITINYYILNYEVIIENLFEKIKNEPDQVLLKNIYINLGLIGLENKVISDITKEEIKETCISHYIRISLGDFDSEKKQNRCIAIDMIYNWILSNLFTTLLTISDEDALKMTSHEFLMATITCRKLINNRGDDQATRESNNRIIDTRYNYISNIIKERELKRENNHSSIHCK